MGDGRSGMGERVKEVEKGNMGETWEMITRRIIKKNHNDNSNKSTLNIHCYAMLLHTQRASFRTFFAVYFGADPGFVWAFGSRVPLVSINNQQEKQQGTV